MTKHLLTSMAAAAILFSAASLRPAPALASQSVHFTNKSNAYVYFTVLADRFIPIGSWCVQPGASVRRDFLIVQGVRARFYAGNNGGHGVYGHCTGRELNDSDYIGSMYQAGRDYWAQGNGESTYAFYHS